MLPTNPQSLTAADRSVLENLRQQGEQIDRQTKVLETLIDRVTRQMRSDEKLEKGNKKDKSEIKGDTRVKDVPGILFDKFSDSLNDFIGIGKGFNSIKDKFKEDKSKPIDKSKEPPLKDKKPKDENDILKNILSNMVSTSKYQEQMLEHTKAIQSIADKTFVSINDLKDNLQNAEQLENNTTIEDIEKPKADKKEQNVRKLKVEPGKLNPALTASNDNAFAAANDETKFNVKKLPDSIGVSIGKNLKPQFDVLGKIFKDSLSDGFDQLDDSISNLKGIGLPSVIPVPNIPGPAATTAGNAGKIAGTAAAGTAAAASASAGLKGTAGTVLKSAGILGAGFVLGEQLFGTSDEELATLRAADEKKKGTQAQVRAIDNKIESAESERNAADKKTGGRYTEGRLQRRADKIKPEYLKFAQKFYNDPNLQDPDYLSLPENKGILELLEERQKENLLPEIEKVTPRKRESTSLMKAVTDERAELSTNNKASAPVIINNTNNNVADSGSSMGFASARPTDPNDSVRDYKRNNARLYDSA